MDLQEINKSLNQMRSMFAFFAVISILNVVLGSLYLGNPNNANGFLACTVLYSFLGIVIFYRGYKGIKNKDAKGYHAARDASKLFVLGFPVLTFFGISYLRKLAKPEFKQVFGIIQS